MPIEHTVDGKAIRVNVLRNGEKCLDIVFINNEFPKADLEFTTVEGGEPPKEPGGKAKPGIVRRWHLLDGNNYKLPLHIIEHVNSLKIPESRFEEDPQTGQMTHIVTYMRHRFTCQPINLSQIVGAKDDKKSNKDGEEE